MLEQFKLPHIATVSNETAFSKVQDDVNILNALTDDENLVSTSSPTKVLSLWKTNPAELLSQKHPSRQISVSHASFPTVSAYHQTRKYKAIGSKEASGAVRNFYMTGIYAPSFTAKLVSEAASQ